MLKIIQEEWENVLKLDEDLRTGLYGTEQR